MTRFVNKVFFISFLHFLICLGVNAAVQSDDEKDLAQASKAPRVFSDTALLDLSFLENQNVISFAGTGVELAHTLGVVRWLYENKIHEREDVTFIGASGGSMASLILASGIQITEEKLKEWIDDFSNARKEYPISQGLFHSDDMLRDSKLFKDLSEVPDLHLKVKGKLAISITKHPFSLFRSQEPAANKTAYQSALCGMLENMLVAAWESTDDVLKCVRASSLIPLLARGTFSTYWGNKYYGYGYYIDGGYSATGAQPEPENCKQLLEVNPYFASGEYPTFWLIEQLNAFRSLEWFEKRFEEGYQDAQKKAAEGFWNSIMP